ncbi:MAG: hypothetical protein IKI21_13230 [Oscillospiraceae bacterium]|nr:hypothetical protein [Oscillospiraceae bacterium]
MHPAGPPNRAAERDEEQQHRPCASPEQERTRRGLSAAAAEPRERDRTARQEMASRERSDRHLRPELDGCLYLREEGRFVCVDDRVREQHRQERQREEKP